MNATHTIVWPGDYRNGLRCQLISTKGNAWTGVIARVRLTDFVQLFDIPVQHLEEV